MKMLHLGALPITMFLTSLPMQSYAMDLAN